MAYNLESLIRILDETLQQQPERVRDKRRTSMVCCNLDFLKKNPHPYNHKKSRALLESLFEKVCSLKQLLENTLHIIIRGSSSSSKEMEALESEIRDAAHEAEDIIESDTVDQLLGNPNAIINFLIFRKKLSKLIKKLDVAREELMKLIKDQSHDTIDAAAMIPLDYVADDPISSKQQDTVVGFDEDKLQLKARLTRPATKLTIIPIVGMGGIGKTTLARNLYNDPYINENFDLRAWVTVSKDHNVRAIMLNLLGCIIGNVPEETDDKLALLLYQRLYGKRYLIVIDDIWSAEAWDEMKRFFPNNENHGSHILLTTRESHVAKHADSSCEEHQMHLLNNLQSWELLQHKVFGKDHCPPSLEKIGQKIAYNCRGLPLAISVIGGILSADKNSTDLWKQVATDVTSVIAEEKDEQFSNILTLSYNHLPHHLKPCLLYMAAFPEDYEVRASKLTKLWVAEGLLKKKPIITESKYLEEEEVGEEYLKALVDRNLLSIRQYKSNGKAKSYSIHDLLRELCVKKARQENFFHVTDPYIREESYNNIRRASSHRASSWIVDVCASNKCMPVTRSLLCIEHYSNDDLGILSLFSKMKLLRVLDIYTIQFKRFPKQILQLVNLRFLAIGLGSSIPSGISRLRNMQTLIIQSSYHEVLLPSELWEMLELRHFELRSFFFEFEHGYQMTKVQEKLQTLSGIEWDDLVRTGMLTKIPNIKKLAICVVRELESVDLSHLHNLETLMLVGASPPLPQIEFPPSIRKLTLRRYIIPQTFMSNVGSLPNLQVLKIKGCEFDEAEWELSEGEFRSLQFLMLYNVKNLMRWKLADDDSTAIFPRLRHLVMRECHSLEGIPRSFGDIATLEKIEVDHCRNPALVASARQIEEEQRGYGNESLQILITE